MSFHPNDPLEPGQWVIPPADVPPDLGPYNQYAPHFAPPYPAPGYSQYPMPDGQWPGGPQRPGQIMAAAVLGYITAGLLILAGLLLLIGATVVNDISDSLDGNDHGLTAEFVFDGLGNLVAAGLLIAGGSLLTTGKPGGRIWIALGTAIVSAFSIYWIIRTQWNGVIGWGIVFTAMPIIAVCLAFSGPVTDWLARQPRR